MWIGLRGVVDLRALIDRAVAARSGLLDPAHEGALRLFNGFYEGDPALALDLYARSLLVHDYAESPAGDEAAARRAVEAVRARLPWIRAVLWKVRGARQAERRNGCLLLGERQDLDRRVREGGVSYAVTLDRSRDAGLYLDTRNLRAWAQRKLAGKRVLNTFVYTGSLGVAARAGGAREVIHVDVNRAFLDVAKDSYALNGFPVRRSDFRALDFFVAVARLRKEGALFDCVFLDPPFFSRTAGGTVDQQTRPDRLIDKVRPLLGDGGWLVAVNNALFLSGADWMKALEGLCAGGYLTLEETLPVPPDFTGYPATLTGTAPVDPAPFNHSTKIAVLRVRRKDGRRVG